VLKLAKQKPEKYPWLTELLARKPFKSSGAGQQDGAYGLSAAGSRRHLSGASARGSGAIGRDKSGQNEQLEPAKKAALALKIRHSFNGINQFDHRGAWLARSRLYDGRRPHCGIAARSAC
jgi:hypothetical protein